MLEQMIWIQSNEGIRSLEPTLPNCWEGEVDCVVGPFSSKTVAQHFATVTIDYAQYDVTMESIFANRDAWYVEVKKLNA